MHTIMVISGGLALLAVLCAIGWAKAGATGLRQAAKWFLPVWLVASIINLSVGVLTAGYTVMQELPVLAPVFGAPAFVALAAARWAKGKA